MSWNVLRRTGFLGLVIALLITPVGLGETASSQRMKPCQSGKLEERIKEFQQQMDEWAKRFDKEFQKQLEKKAKDLQKRFESEEWQEQLRRFRERTNEFQKQMEERAKALQERLQSPEWQERLRELEERAREFCCRALQE